MPKRKPKNEYVPLVSTNEINILYQKREQHNGDQEYSEIFIKGWAFSEDRDYQYTRFNFDTMPIDFIPDINAQYYLVVGIYQSGDSFTTTYGNEDFVFVYTDYNAAKESVAILLNAANEGSRVNIQIPTNTGTTMSFRPPWMGYFEHLQEIFIEPVRFVGLH